MCLLVRYRWTPGYYFSTSVFLINAMILSEESFYISGFLMIRKFLSAQIFVRQSGQAKLIEVIG